MIFPQRRCCGSWLSSQDADSPAGAQWMRQWSVKGLPSYVVLDPRGRELGRIPLERKFGVSGQKAAKLR